MSESGRETGTRPVAAQPFEPAVRFVPGSPAGVAPSRVKPAVIFPEPDPGDVTEPAPQSRIRMRLPRPAAYVGSALGGALLVFALSWAVRGRVGAATAGGSRSGSGADTASPAAAIAVFDRRADTLAMALSAFTIRASMYDSRRMPCSGLQRGLAQVEDAWLVYNVARKDLMAGADPVRDARDRSLYADVRSVEARFERSSCTRP